MPHRLLQYGFSRSSPKRMWRDTTPKTHYDAVIVGGGVHGLGCAYYLAKEHGMRNVAVLEQGYLGGGSSGRNTAIVRSNYMTPEGVRFYNESVRLYESLAQELDFNLMFSQRGHLTLAHSDATLNVMRLRAETNRLAGIDTRLISRREINELVPELDLSERPHRPVLGGLFHTPGGIIRHDAVVWAYARAADALGVDILQRTACEDVLLEGGRVAGVETNRGAIQTPRVHNATAGWCTTIANMAGVRLPVVTQPLQACVTEPLKPFLHTIVGSEDLHVYLSQSDRGELVMGSSLDPFPSYSLRSGSNFLEGICAHVLALFPALHSVNVLRQWSGLCDTTPDFNPIIGSTPVDGFTLDVGWGTYGFKAAPAASRACATLMAEGRTPEVVAPFSLSRFEQGRPLFEDKGATGHY